MTSEVDIIVANLNESGQDLYVDKVSAVALPDGGFYVVWAQADNYRYPDGGKPASIYGQFYDD